MKITEPKKDYDVLIVGAGLVGASAALGLSALGQRVLLLDAIDIKADDQDASPSFDERSTALSQGSKEILQRLGVWGALSSSLSPIRDIHVSEKGRVGITRMHASDYSLDALGYVAPNKALGTALFGALRETTVELLSPAIVDSIQAIPGGHQIRIQSAQPYEVQVKLLVVVDGAGSSTARKLGIEFETHSYKQSALIANVETYEAHRGCAYERFTAEGPMALLPLNEVNDAQAPCSTSRRFALVWTVPEDNLAAVIGMDEQQKLASLDRAFGGRLGGFTRIGAVAHYPLSLVQATEQFRPGILLLGNAAHSLHPVAGQGFNLALRGLASALSACHEGLQAGQQLGDIAMLKEAVARHELDKTLTIQASDQLVKQFSERSLWKGLLRDLGLLGLNNLPAAKQLFVEQAMGMSTPAQQFGGGRV